MWCEDGFTLTQHQKHSEHQQAASFYPRPKSKIEIRCKSSPFTLLPLLAESFVKNTSAPLTKLPPHFSLGESWTPGTACTRIKAPGSKTEANGVFRYSRRVGTGEYLANCFTHMTISSDVVHGQKVNGGSCNFPTDTPNFRQRRL